MSLFQCALRKPKSEAPGASLRRHTVYCTCQVFCLVLLFSSLHQLLSLKMAHLKLAQSNCADVTTAHEHYYDAVMIYYHLTGEQSDPLGKELEMGQNEEMANDGHRPF